MSALDLDCNDVIVDYVYISNPQTSVKNANASPTMKKAATRIKRSPKVNKASSKISPQKSIREYFKTVGKVEVNKERATLKPSTMETTLITPTIEPNQDYTIDEKTEVRVLIKHENVSLSQTSGKGTKRLLTAQAPPAKKKLIMATNDLEPIAAPATTVKENQLTFMIEQVMKFQAMTFAQKQRVECLISEKETGIIKAFSSLSESAQVLFVKRYFGVKKWHRVGTDASSLAQLEANGLVVTDLNGVELADLLKLLNQKELAELGKKYAGTRVGGKERIISAIVKSKNTQKSVMQFVGGKKPNREELIKKDALASMGKLYQLSELSRSAMNHVVLLFSLAHNVDDEKKRAESQRYFVSRIQSGELKFAAYQISPVVIFETRGDFLEYESALDMKKRMEEALAEKDYKKMELIAKKSRKFLERLLKDDTFIMRFLKLPSFLKRFSAGSVLAYVLTQFCENLKKQQNTEFVISILSSLLNQDKFGVGLRGKWYELLVQVLLSSQKMKEAVQVLLNASTDPTLNEVRGLSLQIKAHSLSKRKAFKENYGEWSQNGWEEPASIEISGQALGNVVGFKLVYVQKAETGAEYVSVEELAIKYYKSHGYPKGIHEEGLIVSTLVFILFFDIIYQNVSGAFLSPFQDRPLDFYSSLFFVNRETELTQRLNEMSAWTDQDLTERILNVFNDYYNTYCVIAWKANINAELLTEIATCLGMPVLKVICERFVKQPRVSRSGFPDLTLWDIETKKCKFVEVKSPNDKLAPNQRVWLSFLKSNGIDCEVCNVRNVGGKIINKN